MFSTICVGYDGSKPSDNALRTACGLAQSEGATVHVVYARHPETVAFALGAVPGYVALDTMPSREDIQKAAEKVLAKARETAVGAGFPTVHTHVSDGDPAKAVIQHARLVGADLIVTGRRGVGNLSALFLGSTSLEIAHSAPCAHLTVR